MNRPVRPEVTGRRAGLSGALWPPAFLPITMACAYLGISRTRLYGHLVPLDPTIIVQVGGRTLVDIPRAMALIDAMPRGPRKPNGRGGGGGKGRTRRP
jgi:hypothetical protein